MRTLCAIVWWRLTQWLEPNFPELAWLPDEEYERGPACDSCGRDWALRFSPDHGANFCDGCYERENLEG